MKFIYKLTPYIIIFLAAMIFACTVTFKTMAEKNFLSLDTHLNSLKFEQDLLLQKESLEQECLPYTYFDEDTQSQLERLFSVSREAKNEAEYERSLEAEVFELEKLLHRRQQELVFGFDRMMYSSILLAIIAVTVIIYDLFSARNELNRSKAISEQQLKFSRDLHDGVAQDLAALKVYLQKKDEPKTEYYADQALKEVRFLIDSMHRDFSKSFSETIKEILQDFETNYGINTVFINASENLNRIPYEKQMELLRILQEALSNIARHSEATKVTVQLAEVGEDLKFNIRDNGIGFEKNAVSSEGSAVEHKHHGVKNIEERVQMLGGSVQFINQGGTTIAITIKNIIH